MYLLAGCAMMRGVILVMTDRRCNAKGDTSHQKD
jgi:hypothetical protein